MGMADPWAVGWYCTGCGHAVARPKRYIRDARGRFAKSGYWSFACPVHGAIKVLWPNG